MVRIDVEKVLEKNLSTYRLNENSSKAYETIKSLKEKDCFYVKADKGNALVVIKKEDYFSGMFKHIDDSHYIKLKKNPLNVLVNGTKKLIKDVLLVNFEDVKIFSW